mmetsp:Transcript_351/g.795  ORF Transcript_351/g.795 Transcript_351/m.795 type:complete len:90 (-) Transcript_351:42-311(-)
MIECEVMEYHSAKNQAIQMIYNSVVGLVTSIELDDFFHTLILTGLCYKLSLGEGLGTLTVMWDVFLLVLSLFVSSMGFKSTNLLFLFCR